MSMEQLRVRVPDDVEAAIAEYAEDNDVDDSVAARRALARGLEQYGYLHGESAVGWSLSTLGYALLAAAIALLIATAPTAVDILPTALPLAALGGTLVVVVRVLPHVRSWTDNRLRRGEPS